MYPLKFKPIYFEKIWGGRGLEAIKDNLPQGDIGESWEISCHKNGSSIISNGKYEGITLKELITLYKDKVLGERFQEEEFPLLLKFISASDNLSVQVHPNDYYAKLLEEDRGKTEAWYVLEAEEGANLIIGTKGCNKNDFMEGIERGTLEKCLNIIPVKKGDVFFIESGLIHAIGKGVVLLEIQQSSDITYRVYDYNRGREIHVDKAMKVIDFNLSSEKLEGELQVTEDYHRRKYISCKYFEFEEYIIRNNFKDDTRGEKFFLYSCIEGEGKIVYSEGEESIIKGESILIPCSLGKVKILGQLKLIKVHVP
ncbi:type I phosphomannose isomerase catalytic subunit [Clostridium sp. UBA4548]|uniref:type I phosphomannose isomerase catalytic subunit n=1 Tax=Clostridium sp. UBA4548 TaxID=1946361 RepID=UPI0025C0037B|nr:type I phosphomannose isomerase catalytic subunit [Clostridium sp. UBA4548]